MDNSDKIILDLCGGTGSWGRPYKEAGYDYRLVTLPDNDVRYYHPPKHVYGILAAPPCTDFCISGVRWWASKDKTKGLLEALSVVAACLRIINIAKPHFWALENPVGRLPRYIGKYKYTFQPYEYGDPWTKRTCIWGKFNMPVKTPVTPNCALVSSGHNRKLSENKYASWTGGTPSGLLGLIDHMKDLPADWVHSLPPSKDRAMLRSITPPGFARAFFLANQ